MVQMRVKRQRHMHVNNGRQMERKGERVVETNYETNRSMRIQADQDDAVELYVFNFLRHKY